jgi:hypothetical protein
MAGPASNPVQGFRALRVLRWEFLRLRTGFELPSSRSEVPCYGVNRNRNILDLMRWPHAIDLGAQDFDGCNDQSKFLDRYYNLPVYVHPRLPVLGMVLAPPHPPPPPPALLPPSVCLGLLVVQAITRVPLSFSGRVLGWTTVSLRKKSHFLCLQHQTAFHWPCARRCIRRLGGVGAE